MELSRKRARVEENRKTVVISCDSDKPELHILSMPALANVQDISGYRLQWMLRTADVFMFVRAIAKSGVYREGGAALVPFRYKEREIALRVPVGVAEDVVQIAALHPNSDFTPWPLDEAPVGKPIDFVSAIDVDTLWETELDRCAFCEACRFSSKMSAVDDMIELNVDSVKQAQSDTSKLRELVSLGRRMLRDADSNVLKRVDLVEFKTVLSRASKFASKAEGVATEKRRIAERRLVEAKAEAAAEALKAAHEVARAAREAAEGLVKSSLGQVFNQIEEEQIATEAAAGKKLAELRKLNAKTFEKQVRARTARMAKEEVPEVRVKQRFDKSLGPQAKPLGATVEWKPPPVKEVKEAPKKPKDEEPKVPKPTYPSRSAIKRMKRQAAKAAAVVEALEKPTEEEEFERDLAAALAASLAIEGPSSPPERPPEEPVKKPPEDPAEPRLPEPHPESPKRPQLEKLPFYCKFPDPGSPGGCPFEAQGTCKYLHGIDGSRDPSRSKGRRHLKKCELAACVGGACGLVHPFKPVAKQTKPAPAKTAVLECAVCFGTQSFMAMPCGHLVCINCVDLLGGKCHTCRDSFEKTGLIKLFV